MKHLNTLSIAVGIALVVSSSFAGPGEADAALAKLVAEDVARPVRPALVNGQPFWNEKARLFMYPPSFAFTNVAGAAKYRYRVTDDRLGEHAFEADVPTATLEPVWADLPAGWVKVEVTALDAKGAACGTAGGRRFWKSAPYRPGAYPKPEITVAECLDAYFDWLCGMKNTRLIRETGEGDPDYVHNCYPAKMYGALARGFVRYAEMRPGRREELLLTARRCCDFLISVSQPEGTPLAFFPPTYRGTRMAAERYAGMNMLIYAADAGLAYLAVHGATKDAKYLDAAERLAATYLRLQGKDGTWHLKLYEKDGRPVCENRLFPMRVIEFLEELYRRTGKEAYRAAADRAFAFIEKGPLADWNWEGQFEDVKPSAPYQNLTKHSACETAIYLVRRFPGDRAVLAKARELLRFAEDQFVCWEMPARADFSSSPLEIEDRDTGVRHWRILPAALEQYGWYVPIDASNAKLLRTYLALYRAEGSPLDLAKARTMADSIVRAQTALGTGSIPTQWIEWDMLPTSEPWVNCSVAAALALLELQDVDAARDAGKADDRVTSLLGRMTLEEKVGQLCERVTQDLSLVNGGDMEGRAFDNAIVDVIRRGEVGTFVGVPGPEAYNLYQKAAVEGSRLGIPLMFGRGYVHGCHVTFPIPLAQSCSWEPELFRRTCEFTAAEARGEGVNWFFAPMLDIARDARWGRIAESLGADPVLASRIAADVVRGCQGSDPSDGRHVAACAKHFVGYGAGEGGRDYNGAEIGDDLLHNVYLPPFKAAIEAGVMTVMPAFSTLCGSPCSTDRRLLRDILRDELGFRGFTVSDWDALGECGKNFHGVADGDVALATLAINAGMDVDMLSTAYAKGLAEAVRRGLVKERTLDEAVANVLRVKEKLGLLERPYLDLKGAAGFVDRAKGLELAREAGRKSCVLLKNKGGVLPFRRGARLALGGPLADAATEMYGCWTINVDCNTNQSLRAGLEADGFKVEMWSKGETQADAIVLALGEKGDESGENTSRTDLTLPRGQMELVRAAKATGRPVVVVLFNGRPLAVPELNREADAVLEAWQLGSCCGWAVADVLAGVAEPYGRLTVDFPQSSGQCPFYYNRLPTGRPNDDVLVYSEGGRWATRYTDVPLRAVYPFGFGLTYTEFRYSEESAVVVGDEVVLSARIANVGKRRGSEVVQAYVRDRVAEMSRPRRELKGFVRVELAPGESRRVEIRVPRAELAYWANGRRTEAKGEFLAWIAPDSDSGRRLSFTLP